MRRPWRAEEGEELAWGWGIAWRRPCDLHAFCLPMPLNVLAGLARRYYYRVAQGAQPALLEKLRHELLVAVELRSHYCKQIEKLLEQESQLRQRNVALLRELQYWRRRASELRQNLVNSIAFSSFAIPRPRGPRAVPETDEPGRERAPDH